MGSSDGGCDTRAATMGGLLSRRCQEQQAVQKGRRGSRRAMSHLLLADQISGASQCRDAVGRAQDTRRQGQLPRTSSPGPTPPLQYIHRIATSSPAQGPKGQGSLPEWPRRNIAGSGENRQVVLCCTVVGESAPAEEVPRSGGVLNAAKLTQDWPRGKAFPTGWQGQACSGAFNAEFILISCKCLL